MTSRAVLPFDLDVGICVRPMPGEAESGDSAATFPVRSGLVVAMADGLGHGVRAAEAARRFIHSVSAHAELSLVDLFAVAHRQMRGTRGAVAALARIDVSRGELSVAGVGNITATVVHAASRTSPFLMTPGVLGTAYRRVRPQDLSLAQGDTLVLCSDGIRARFDFSLLHDVTAQYAAERLVRWAGKPTDDAACVVVRVLPDKRPSQHHIPRATPKHTPSLPGDP